MYQYQNYSPNQVPKAVKGLLIANIAVFFLRLLMPNTPWLYLALTPILTVKNFMIWQPVTYLFLHGDFTHILFNMFMLWMFGGIIERTLGFKRFLIFYFFCGIGAALCCFPFSYLNTTLGASGAIFGLFVAYAMLFPDNIILVLFIIPMRAKYAALLYAGVELIFLISLGGNSPISYIGHLGGALFGWIYFKSQSLRDALTLVEHFSLKKTIKQKKKKQQTRYYGDLDKKVNEILDKISKYGIESITPQERRILKQKSETSRQ